MDNRIYQKTFLWLFVGLFVTFLCGYSLSVNTALLESILRVGLIPIIVLEIGLALIMGLLLNKLSATAIKICYLVYSAVTGITFSSIFIYYKMSSIISIFMVSSIIFLLLALYGYFTKKDVTTLGKILFMTLIGTIILSIINIFMGNSYVELVTSIVVLFVFMGYIIYDINRLKYLDNNIEEDKLAVYSAFQLYLDFINIFIRLLRFFGKRND